MSQSDPARQRFIVLQLLRLSGAFFALLGLLVVARRVDMPMVAGYVFLIVGFIDLFVVPLLLARRWKSPPP
ncbi:hypothetical protein B0I00_1720 [Novosphingobium kunmingense]|uniref:Uncharacterized protein n=1 Tax=Novosphingobium kunmingense TaxID=1211806 RepID=A0A2N0HKK4_9SPHN|nr:hypothetical protein [Novosphingobium kunmingense]PKB19484.1 hypothetical protein B0I00_1720 [Novosphingobium kunmingense]